MRGVTLATVKFSLPDDFKEYFNATFRGQNKSAIIADLMREAVERARREQRSHDAIGRILERRLRAPVLSESEIREAREDGRP
jgi:hypothetical protein